jgi:hypothetical protein
MPSVRTVDLPTTALLQHCRAQGAYTDCYAVDVDGVLSHADFVAAFYTTPLFKLERAVLRWFAARGSTDADARRLADGATATFAAWRVEARADDQLLLADFTGRTKSWLMVRPGADAGTTLYFGSAVLPAAGGRDGQRRMGPLFHALLGCHRLYSRLLLGAARRRALSQRPPRRP